MLLKMAWLNVWRNKLRSFVVIFSIIIGLWAGTFISGFYTGIFQQRIDEVIHTEIGHFQFHHKKFRDELDNLPYFVEGSSAIIKELKNDSVVDAIAQRTIVPGVVKNPRGYPRVQINGIDPSAEAKIRKLNEKVVEGDYLDATDRKKPVMISQKFAEKYRYEIGEKLHLSIPGFDNKQQEVSYRIVGIFKTANAMMDEGNVYVKAEHLQANIGKDDVVHELAVLLKNNEQLDSVLKKYKKYESETVEVKSWIDISPGMRMMMDSMDTSMAIMVNIILLALIFGIVNTLLMAVLERVREIGMLMAIGMNKGKVFMMIILESVFFALIGGPLGLLLGYLTINYFGKAGIDLSYMAETLEQMGYSSMLYPTLETEAYVSIGIRILIFTIIAAIYPAYKALRLKPVEAIRKQ